MRTDTNQVKMIVIRFQVNQDQIRFYMAVSVIHPFTGKRMVKVSARQCHISGEQIHDIHKGGIKSFAMPS
jgi:hypothetical protein